jgi:hypothetical protein
VNADLRVFIDPKAEFKQIFDEAWRNQRDYLYVTNEHGSDWPKMKTMYGALLPSVNHRADLNYLIDMMGSEISIGHSYVRGGDMPDVPAAVPGGLLGADFEIDQGRYKITKIYDDESWNPDLRAPLAAPGVDVRVGDYIIAINGQDLKAPDNIYRLLDGTANKQVSLTVNATPTETGARNVTVVPVANEQTLRTRAWIEDSRRLVDSLSHGQLAYVYLPNTGQPGYTSFNRYYFAQQDRKGAIIDERYNGGGQAADYIIDVLQRTFDGYFNNVAGDRMPFTSPAAGIWGPKVMVINEMAGSGGDLMPYMFRYRKVGTLVGKRTWGGRTARRLLRARRKMGRGERRRRARHRRREHAKGSHRRPRSAARGGRERRTERVGGASRGTDDERAAGADVGQARQAADALIVHEVRLTSDGKAFGLPVARCVTITTIEFVERQTIAELTKNSSPQPRDLAMWMVASSLKALPVAGDGCHD